jgi:hypothetical protein
VEGRQPNLHTGNGRNICFRSNISVATLAFILAIATLQISGILIPETSQSVYGQSQVTVIDNNNKVRGLSGTSPWLDINLKPTTSNVIMIAAASIFDNGNSNTPLILPSPSSSQLLNNNSSNVGRSSNTSPSNNVVNSESHSQSLNSNNENSTNTHHYSLSSSQANIVSSNYNHVGNQHIKHIHGSIGHIINQVASQTKQQFTVGDIPFP